MHLTVRMRRNCAIDEDTKNALLLSIFSAVLSGHNFAVSRTSFDRAEDGEQELIRHHSNLLLELKEYSCEVWQHRFVMHTFTRLASEPAQLTAANASYYEYRDSYYRTLSLASTEFPS